MGSGLLNLLEGSEVALLSRAVVKASLVEVPGILEILGIPCLLRSEGRAGEYSVPKQAEGGRVRG